MGHWGASGQTPDNTHSTLRLTAPQGAEWVDFDVKITTDKGVVLLHDDTLGQIKSGRSYAGQMSYAQILKFVAGQWHKTRKTNV